MNPHHTHRVLRSVAVFCGASLGNDPRFAAGARELGTLLASRGITLLYGGGNVGLMGAIADAALTAGGQVIGVIPRVLVEREVAHRGITEQIVVETMHERKQILADRSDAFIAMPGGYGTFDELFEAVTWNQLGIQDKPVGLLNVAGFYDHLIAMLDHAASVALVPPANRRLVMASRDAGELIGMLEKVPPIPHARWASGERR